MIKNAIKMTLVAVILTFSISAVYTDLFQASDGSQTQRLLDGTYGGMDRK